ncbi:18417_t:CDS:10, partial [Racocetra persica]
MKVSIQFALLRPIFLFSLCFTILPTPLMSQKNSTTNTLRLLDPLLYSTVKTSNAGVENVNGEKCIYISTPQKEDNVTVNGQLITWNCPAGHFCPNFNKQFDCTPGFFCPENSAQPNYCCQGFYCSEDTKSIQLCPEGHFCTLGTINPVPCTLAICPPGSIKQNKYFVAIIVIGFIIVIIGLFHCKKRFVNKKNVEYDNILNDLANQDKEDLLRTRGSKSINISVEFNNLTLQLRNGKTPLNGVSGLFLPGRTCAIMGPSGSGKSTLISILAGKIKATNGELKVNDEKVSLAKYRKLVGFVPQEDIMIRKLTVREILVHSALMRLPTDMPVEDKKRKAMEVIKFLKLDHVLNDEIGDEEKRGISGGERKRVNIGMELVAEPSILFLDEPTSGLDSVMSYEVCKMLKYIAEIQNITIVAIVHSPSQKVFKTFDDVLVLNEEGKSEFSGRTKYVIEDFNSRNPRGAEEGPQDYIMVNTSRGGSASRSNTENKLTVQNQFINMLEDCISYIVDVILEIYSTLKSLFTSLICKDDEIRNTPNIFYAFYLLLGRALVQVYRRPSQFLFDQLLHLGCGVFVSLAISNSGYIGKPPKEICDYTPYVMMKSCENSSDFIQ